MIITLTRLTVTMRVTVTACMLFLPVVAAVAMGRRLTVLPFMGVRRWRAMSALRRHIDDFRLRRMHLTDDSGGMPGCFPVLMNMDIGMLMHHRAGIYHLHRMVRPNHNMPATAGQSHGGNGGGCE
jgi:hypothetical protein